ncbi:MAG: hypothetical protein Q4G50_02980 [Corynebacterium sp.]|uniref:hypothetical protein n=1 Tax=Corynebacterium sp. TaxID=1720 RepID=UPI0026DEA2A4|nr:hypothetical protein [Corynebacterium sp.]MDO5668948.1 hypothetical protein [Corynebacterium sp.]
MLRFDPNVEIKKIAKLAKWIDNDAGQWILEIEQVSSIAAQRPVQPPMDTAILGDSSKGTFLAYQRVSAVINETSRKIGPVRYLGFYHGRRIEPFFPEIIRIEVPTTWNHSVASELKKSPDPEAVSFGKIMSFGLNNGFPAGKNYEVYILTEESAYETLRTLSASPIHHYKEGRGSAFVKGGLRYFASSSLVHATETSELV